MEFFKTLLFGIAGLSMIFWVAVIGLWHVDMFPRFFKEDRTRKPNQAGAFNGSALDLDPTVDVIGLFNRNKYARKSIVVADFNPVDETYSVNRLYTSILFSMGIASFVLITYGLHSAFLNL